MNEWKITLQDRLVQQFRLEEGQTLVLGRGTESDVVLDNQAISRRHLSLQLLNGVCFVNDLGSTNGTLLNDTKVTGPTPVAPQDTVRIGKFQLAPVAAKQAAAQAAPADMESTVFVAPNANPAKREVSRPPRLTLVRGKAQPAGCNTEGKASVIIGKAAGSDLRLSGWLIDSPQCRVVLQGDRYVLIADGRWRATLLNGVKVTGAAPLQRGDEIGVAGTRIRFE